MSCIGTEHVISYASGFQN